MEFDEDRYKKLQLPHPELLFWIINPGFAINELLLGQRIPRVRLIDRTVKGSVWEGRFTPCPHCGAVNDGRYWYREGGLWHWFGLLCPNCYEKIPCIWNLTSLVILITTFPLWIWFKLWGEASWMEKEKRRLSAIDGKCLPIATVDFLKIGFISGVGFFCLNVFQKMFGNRLTEEFMVSHAVESALAGTVFGVVMKWWSNRKARQPR